MIEYSEIIKQSKAYKIIEQDARQGKIAHSYMIICEDKITLQSFLTLMTEVFYCPTHNACGNCLECQKIEHNNNPNIYKLKSDGAIKVEDIKELVLDTYIAPTEDKIKTYIIENAEQMNEASQNKLLKTLEEPTDGVIIILGTANEQAMLQTIKSRAKKLYLNVWTEENILNELLKIGTDLKNAQLASKFSKGNISKAISLLTDENFQKTYENMLDVLKNYTGTSMIAKYSKIFGDDKEQLLYAFSILDGIIANLIYDKTHNIANELNDLYDIKTLANIYDLIIDNTKRLNSNCNPQGVATNFLLLFAETKFLLS